MSKVKTIIVTGGAKGIGQATVRAFHKEGANVSFLDFDDQAGKKLEKELGKRVLFVKCDVSQENQVKSAVKDTIKKFGHINVLVNSAGVQRYSTVTETSEKEWDEVMGINLKSQFLCAKHVIPSMLKKGSGVIINISSVQAFLSQNNVAPYTTSKTAILGLTRSIAIDYAPKIRCIAICPGSVDTPMLREAINQSPNPKQVLQECYDMHPLKTIAKPEWIASLIVDIASEKYPFITGQAIRIDGGLGLNIGGSKKS